MVFPKKTFQLEENLKPRQITMASYTRKFEISFAQKIGAKYALMVNRDLLLTLLQLLLLEI